MAPNATGVKALDQESIFVRVNLYAKKIEKIFEFTRLIFCLPAQLFIAFPTKSSLYPLIAQDWSVFKLNL